MILSCKPGRNPPLATTDLSGSDGTRFIQTCFDPSPISKVWGQVNPGWYCCCILLIVFLHTWKDTAVRCSMSGASWQSSIAAGLYDESQSLSMPCQWIGSWLLQSIECSCFHVYSLFTLTCILGNCTVTENQHLLPLQRIVNSEDMLAWRTWDLPRPGAIPTACTARSPPQDQVVI